MNLKRKLSALVTFGFFVLAGCAAQEDPGTNVSPPGAEENEVDGRGEGCWVHLYDGDNFDEQDDNFRLTEPGRYENLANLPGADQDWTGEADSLRVGANATVTSWPEEDFAGEQTKLDAGAEDPDMKDEPRSLQLECN